MYIERDLEVKILNYLDSPEILAVVGPRQCGKTTMLKHILEKQRGFVFVSFDDVSVLEMFEKDTDSFVNLYVKGNKILFIDEFHYAKNGGKILKYIYDLGTGAKIIISGSSYAELTIRALKYLVGRVLIFELYPFNFGEFLRAKDRHYFRVYNDLNKRIDFKNPEKVDIPEPIHKKLTMYFEEYILFGGYPRVVLENDYQKKKEILKNIYNTYFLREVRDILGLIDNFKLENLITSLSLQVGGMIDYNKLSRLSDYSYPTLKKYLNFLEKTYIAFFPRPFFRNKRIEIVKSPKVYFYDTGMRNVAINDFRDLGQRQDAGALLENAVASQLIKRGFRINYWRDKKKHEIDFVIDLGEQKHIAIEVKNYLRKTNLKAVERFKKLYPEIPALFAYREIEKEMSKNFNAFPVYVL